MLFGNSRKPNNGACTCVPKGCVTGRSPMCSTSASVPSRTACAVPLIRFGRRSMDRVRLHPSEKDLLLFADGELRKRHAAKIELHLASCWGCRARLAETEGAITGFVTLRRKLLDHQIRSTDFPSGRTSHALLRARMAEIADSSRVPVWHRIRTALLPLGFASRPLWIAGSVAVFLVALLMVEPFFAPSVSAMEDIAKVRAAEENLPQGVVLHQRVRIRRKPQAASPEAAV